MVSSGSFKCIVSGCADSFWGRVRKMANSATISLVLSFFPYGTARLPLDGFS